MRDGFRVITCLSKKISEISDGLIGKLRNRGRCKKRVLEVMKLVSWRSRGKHGEVRNISGEIVNIASDGVKDAKMIVMKGKIGIIYIFIVLIYTHLNIW